MALRIKRVGGAGNSRARLPLEFKVRVLQLVHDGKTAKAAIQTAAAEHNLELKESYIKYAGSHVYRFVQEVGKKAQKDDNVRALCEQAGLQFETEQTTQED
ncbi:MAG: hypothetical protein DRO11_09990 [Methanobacteriota archaeon]|nr:MAG: hypothetical protein DRO11_09990 [Euryarchaeota archaeon]